MQRGGGRVGKQRRKRTKPGKKRRQNRKTKRMENKVNLCLIYSWPPGTSIQEAANIFYSWKHAVPPAWANDGAKIKHHLLRLRFSGTVGMVGTVPSGSAPLVCLVWAKNKRVKGSSRRSVCLGGDVELRE